MSLYSGRTRKLCKCGTPQSRASAKKPGTHARTNTDAHVAWLVSLRRRCVLRAGGTANHKTRYRFTNRSQTWAIRAASPVWGTQETNKKRAYEPKRTHKTFTPFLRLQTSKAHVLLNATRLYIDASFSAAFPSICRQCFLNVETCAHLYILFLRWLLDSLRAKRRVPSHLRGGLQQLLFVVDTTCSVRLPQCVATVLIMAGLIRTYWAFPGAESEGSPYGVTVRKSSFRCVSVGNFSWMLLCVRSSRSVCHGIVVNRIVSNASLCRNTKRLSRGTSQRARVSF